MDEPVQVELQDALTAVMHRFRDSFLGEGINLTEDKVPFRLRSDFPAPLVTVLGHTYGLRLVASPNETSGSGQAVEASVNVYDDEFVIDRFKKDLTDIYGWSQVSRIIANFATPEDEVAMGKDPKQLASMFRFDADADVEVVEKNKKTASIVTGRLVDRVLRVRFGLDESQIEQLRNRDLFVTAVYLYCLRPFAAAYRKSLTAGTTGS